jgi:hypothetical protein
VSALTTSPPRPHARCARCGRGIDCSPTDLRVYTAVGPPKCCGQPMTLPAAQRPAGRTGDHRPPRPGVWVDVRRLDAERGDDLGRGLTTIGPDGAGVRLSAAVAAGDELAVVLVRPDGRPVAPVRAVAQWCRPLGGGLFTAGLGFDRRLGLAELAGLV